MATSGNFDSEIPINLDVASVEEIVACEHLRFDLDTANSLVKYRSGHNITIGFLSEITETPKNLWENLLDAGIVTFNAERILHPSFRGAQPPMSQQHSSFESLYSVPDARSPISPRPISPTKRFNSLGVLTPEHTRLSTLDARAEVSPSRVEVMRLRKLLKETEMKFREENELLKQKVAELETSHRSTPISSCRSTPPRIGLHNLSELQPKIEELALSRSEFSTLSTKSTRSTSSRKPVETAVVISSTRVEESIIPKRTHKLGISPIDKTGVGFVRSQSSQSDNGTLENTVVPQVSLKSSPLDFPELGKDKIYELESSEYESRIHELTKDTTPNVTNIIPESSHEPLNATQEGIVSAIPQNRVYDPHA